MNSINNISSAGALSSASASPISDSGSGQKSPEHQAAENELRVAASYKILVVDDEPDLELMMRQRFRKQIKTGELTFYFAANGVQALDILAGRPEMDLILTDINMPQMDGLTLLSRLHELKTTTKTVVVSAYGDMDNIRVAMNRGAFDFLTKPLDFEDLDITMSKTFSELKQVRQALRFRNQLMAIQKELDIASDIQNSMLPPPFVPSPSHTALQLVASMKPAKEVGGDLYDYFYLTPDKLGFVLGDVSGKGVPAAMFMAMSRMLVKSTALNIPSPAGCITHVNNMLAVESISSMFVTLFYGVLDIPTGTIEFVNAGHNPPYIIPAEDPAGIILLDTDPQIALSILEDYQYHSNTITLKPGDTLFLFTDGVTEAFNPVEDLYGEERLVETLTRLKALPAAEIVKDVMNDVKQFSSGAGQSDDITLLALKYN